MFRISQVWAAITHLHSHASTTGQTADDHHAQLHAAAHQTGSDKVATGTPDGTKFLRDDFAWAAPTAAAAAHVATHQADGNDAYFVKMAPTTVTIPTGYGLVVVGPWNPSGTVTLQGTARMVVL